MKIEYEATFINVNKDEIRKRLKKVGAILVRREYLQKRIPFNLPKNEKNKWVRVRDEGNKITLSLKEVSGGKIENQKELCIEVNDFDNTVDLLKMIGCKPKSYQENKRELWKINDVEITIDTWPFLEPLVEVEGKSEKKVREVSNKIGFDYSKALFCSTTTIYSLKYNISNDKVNKIPKIVFNMKNPFI